jgi:hypothetical protein
MVNHQLQAGSGTCVGGWCAGGGGHTVDTFAHDEAMPLVVPKRVYIRQHPPPKTPHTHWLVNMNFNRVAGSLSYVCSLSNLLVRQE